jgi:hypothetical protein
MKRALAREWLWLFGCAVLALAVVGGMRAIKWRDQRMPPSLALASALARH